MTGILLLVELFGTTCNFSFAMWLDEDFDRRLVLDAVFIVRLARKTMGNLQLSGCCYGIFSTDRSLFAYKTFYSEFLRLNPRADGELQADSKH